MQTSNLITPLDAMHIRAFHSFLKWELAAGTEPELAFWTAIVKSRDDALCLDDPEKVGLLEEWLSKYSHRRGKAAPRRAL